MREKTFVLSTLVFAGALAVNVPLTVAQVSGEAGRTQRDAEGGRPFSGTERGTGGQAGQAGDPQAMERPAVKSPRNAEGGYPFGGTGSTVQGYPQYGARSPEQARDIQQALRQQGYYPGPIDGVIGPRTRQAIRNFQRTHDLPATGIVDSATASALGLDSAAATGAASGSAAQAQAQGKVAGEPQTARPPVRTQRDAEGGYPFGGTQSTVQGYPQYGARSAEHAREIQQALRQQGYNPGPIDGIIGPQTRDAIRDFQQAHDLPVTGIVDGLTADRLGLDGSATGGAMPSGSTSSTR